VFFCSADPRDLFNQKQSAEANVVEETRRRHTRFPRLISCHNHRLYLGGLGTLAAGLSASPISQSGRSYSILTACMEPIWSPSKMDDGWSGIVYGKRRLGT
jgi:hypothetical protein